MADWFERDKLTRRREFVLPLRNGSNDHAQLLQVVHAAKVSRLRSKGLPDDAFSELYDNDVMVTITDDEIVAYYDTIERND